MTGSDLPSDNGSKADFGSSGVRAVFARVRRRQKNTAKWRDLQTNIMRREDKMGNAGKRREQRIKRLKRRSQTVRAA